MDFVDINLAKKLKEKGFREKVNAYYGKYENIFEVHPSLDMNDCDYRCSAPTISQVLKWLRNEKNIHIVIPASYNEGYWWEVRDFNREVPEYGDNEFNSYEQAAIAGIEYVIDNLI